MVGVGIGLQSHPEGHGCLEFRVCSLCSGCQGHTAGSSHPPKPLVPLQYVPEPTAELARGCQNGTVHLQQWRW